MKYNHIREYNFAWADESDVESIGKVFTENVDANYISHGEVFGGRATDFNNWSKDISKIIKQEFKESFNKSDNQSEHDKLAYCEFKGSICGLAFITINSVTKVGILQDIIIDSAHRGLGNGKYFLKWIEQESRSIGVKSLLLESGINNHKAHAFFENNGFKNISIVMSKEL